jgi:hypothetical protein
MLEVAVLHKKLFTHQGLNGNIVFYHPAQFLLFFDAMWEFHEGDVIIFKKTVLAAAGFRFLAHLLGFGVL